MRDLSFKSAETLINRLNGTDSWSYNWRKTLIYFKVLDKYYKLFCHMKDHKASDVGISMFSHPI